MSKVSEFVEWLAVQVVFNVIVRGLFWVTTGAYGVIGWATYRTLAFFVSSGVGVVSWVTGKVLSTPSYTQAEILVGVPPGVNFYLE